MEHPRPPGSLGEQVSNSYLVERLKRDLRVQEPDLLQAELKRLFREQLRDTPVEPSDYMRMLLESLDDRDITPELFRHALDMAQYAPTSANDALRAEDYDDSS